MLKTFYTRFLMIVAALCLFGGGKSYAAVGDEVVVYDEFTATGTTFHKDVNIDWNKYILRVVIDRSTCTNTTEDLVAIGSDVTSKKEVLHVYGGTRTYISGYYERTVNGNDYNYGFSKTPSSSQFTIEISKKKGIAVEGEVNTYQGGMVPENVSALLSLSTVQVGSGSTTDSKSTAKFVKISLVEISEEPDPVVITKTTETDLLKSDFDKDKANNETFQPNATSFSKTHSFDLATQTFKAVIDLSSCASLTTYSNILSIGYSNISHWSQSGVYAIHFYYAKGLSSQTFRIQSTANGSNVNNSSSYWDGSSVPSTELTIEVSSKGLYLNGTQVMTASQVAQVFVGNSLIYGSVETPNSTATYKEFTITTNTSTTVDRLFGDDDSSFTKFAKTGAKVALTRTLGAGYWNTLCLPFSLTADQVKTVFGDGVQLRTYSNVTGSTMNFVSATNIEAGAPYLVKVEEDVVDPIIDGVDVTADEPVAKGDAYAMKGTYTTYALATNGSNLFLGDGDKFYRPADGQNTMKGLRAYFIVPSGTNAAALYANIDGVETAIDEVCADAVVDNHATVYNLNGQVVGDSLRSLPRGIYIQNGKKIVIK